MRHTIDRFTTQKILLAELSTKGSLDWFTGRSDLPNWSNSPELLTSHGKGDLVKCVCMFAYVGHVINQKGGRWWKVIPLMEDSLGESDAGDVIDDTDTDNVLGNKLDG